MLRKLRRRALYLFVTFIIENVVFPNKGWGDVVYPDMRSSQSIEIQA